MSNFPFTKRSIPEKIYPQDATAVAPTAGLNSAWGNWLAIVASTTDAFLCSGILIGWGGLASSSSLITSWDVQVQIGTGGAGSEVVKAWKSFSPSILYTTGAGAQVTFGTGLLLRVAPFIVPASTRMAVRLSCSDKKLAVQCAVQVIGYEPAAGFPLERPVPYNLDAYRKGMMNLQSKVYPTVATIDSGAVQIDVDSTAFTWTRASGSFVTDGFLYGMNVSGTGFANAQNNKIFSIKTVTATVLTMTNGTGSGTGMVTETGSGDEHAIQTSYVASVTSGTSWVVGNYVEIIASAASDMLITSLSSSWGHDDSGAGLTTRSAVYEIGIGAASSEEVVARIGLPSRSTTPAATGAMDLLNPVYVKKGERVAVRMKDNTASVTLFCMLNVDEFA